MIEGPRSHFFDVILPIDSDKLSQMSPELASDLLKTPFMTLVMICHGVSYYSSRGYFHGEVTWTDEMFVLIRYVTFYNMS